MKTINLDLFNDYDSLFYILNLYKNEQIILNFYNLILDYRIILDFIKKNSKECNIYIKNLPYCLNDFGNKIDNDYEITLTKKCFKCNFGINCRGNNNLNVKIKPIEILESKIYRKKYILLMKILCNFLENLGFSKNEIIFGDIHKLDGETNDFEDNFGYSIETTIPYFLFKGYNILYNGVSNKYFREIDNERIYIYLKNDILIKKIFKNFDKNLIFNDNNLFLKYIKLMNKFSIDIVFYNADILDSNIYCYNGFYFYQNPKTNTSLDKIFYLNKSKKNNNLVKKFVINKKLNLNFLEGEFIVFNVKDKKLKKEYLKKDNLVIVGKDTSSYFLDIILKSKFLIIENKNILSHGFIIAKELNINFINGIIGISNLKTGQKIKIYNNLIEIL